MPLVNKLSFTDKFSAQAGFYFRNWEYSIGDAQGPLVFTLGLIIAAALAAIAYHLYRRRSRKVGDLFALEDLPLVHSLLEQSIAERAKYEVRFASKTGKRMHFACTPLSMDSENALTLELSGFVHPQQEWVGRMVNANFRLASEKKELRWEFYEFQSTITGLRRRGNLEYIILQPPERLERKQRRQHLRLEPSGGDILRVDIWPETLTNLEHPEHAAAMASFRHGRKNNTLNVLNISAGGLLLELRAKSFHVDEESLSRGKRLAVRLDVRDFDEKTVKEYMIAARIRNAYADPVTGHKVLGLSFAAYRAAAPDDPEKQRWINLHGKGLEPIEDWVFKRHLELYRQKGIV